MKIEMTHKIFVIIVLYFIILNRSGFRTIVTEEQKNAFSGLGPSCIFTEKIDEKIALSRYGKRQRFLYLQPSKLEPIYDDFSFQIEICQNEPLRRVLGPDRLILVCGFLVVRIASIFVPSYVFSYLFRTFFRLLYFLSKIFIF